MTRPRYVISRAELNGGWRNVRSNCSSGDALHVAEPPCPPRLLSAQQHRSDSHRRLGCSARHMSVALLPGESRAAIIPLASSWDRKSLKLESSSCSSGCHHRKSLMCLLSTTKNIRDIKLPRNVIQRPPGGIQGVLLLRLAGRQRILLLVRDRPHQRQRVLLHALRGLVAGLDHHVALFLVAA